MLLRVLKTNGAALDDLTTEINDYKVGTTVIALTTTQYLYIGMEAPFNHLYFNVSTANSNTSSISKIQYWTGSDDWHDTVEVIDETESGGVSLSTSGRISWFPHKTYHWRRDDTVDLNGNEEIEDMSPVTIYDRFWVRILWDADLSGTTALSWLGYLFSNDNDLYGQYPCFNSTNFKTGFEAGKTDWEEQAVIASKSINRDLKKNDIINHEGQILRSERYQSPCVHRTAQVIYNALGPAYREKMIDAKDLYEKELIANNYLVDDNEDGLLNPKETENQTKMVTR